MSAIARFSTPVSKIALVWTVTMTAVVVLLGAMPAAAADAAEATITAYAAAWNTVDVDQRRALLEKAWADDGLYTDPSAEVKGREALIEHISGFQAQTNGAQILRTSKVDSHHGIRVRFSWKMVSAEGQTLAEGLDYGELDVDGRLKLIVGFFGPFDPLGDSP